jgi:hypothetical protein
MKLRHALTALAVVALAGLAGCGSSAEPTAAPAMVTVAQTVTEPATLPLAGAPSMSAREVREAYEAMCEEGIDGTGIGACSVLESIGRSRCGNMGDCAKVIENSRRMVGIVVDGLEDAGLQEADANLDEAIDEHQDALAEWDAADCTAGSAGVTGPALMNLGPCAAASVQITDAAGRVGQIMVELG